MKGGELWLLSLLWFVGGVWIGYLVRDARQSILDERSQRARKNPPDSGG